MAGAPPAANSTPPGPESAPNGKSALRDAAAKRIGGEGVQRLLICLVDWMFFTSYEHRDTRLILD